MKSYINVAVIYSAGRNIFINNSFCVPFDPVSFIVFDLFFVISGTRFFVSGDDPSVVTKFMGDYFQISSWSRRYFGRFCKALIIFSVAISSTVKLLPTGSTTLMETKLMR